MRRYCDYGYLPKYCGAFLEGLVGTLPDPARVVEIGTGPCCSLHRMLSGLAYHKDAHIWTIDNREINFDRIMDDEFKGRYTAINKNSLDAAQNWSVPLDMLYIDGDHTYEGCTADIIAWEPHLKDGGIIAFDDYGFFLGNVEGAVDDAWLARKWRSIGRIGRFIAFEKAMGNSLEWHKNISWLSQNEPLSFKTWMYLCLGMK